MDNFVVSARKYRPATFQSVVGQSHITTTLQNAIKSHQLAQSFLFCGPRGVGKTSCARIFAKTINCKQPTAEMEACNECESCQSFNESTSFNIFELDAASNSGVDDIRKLIDQVRIPPQGNDYKVYIIDEVHMLSGSAFNAFLKTLEEPPPYAKFILATTEKHKIIPTILSRCQIFDFRRIQTEDITNHLKYVANSEGVSFEEDALHVIAQKSDGGLRDALSMFDQLVSFTAGNLSYANIIENLNVLDYEYYFKITDAILASNIPACLLFFQEILDKGFEGQHFISGISSHFRNLLVCKDPSTHRLLEVTDNVRARYGEQSSNCSVMFLLEALKIADECDLQYKDANNKRLKIEIALMKMASLQNKPLHVAVSTPVPTPAQITPPAPQQTMPQNPPVEKPAATSAPIPQPVKEAPVSMPQNPAPAASENTPAPNSSPQVGIKLPSSSTISINKISDPQAGEKKNLTTANTRQSITQEELDMHWNDFAKFLPEENKGLEFAMKQAKVTLKDGKIAQVQVINSLLEDEIEKVKKDIIDYIKQKTNIESFRISIDVDSEKKERKPYIPREIFLAMSEKNPELKVLRAELDLDIDF